MFRVYCFWFRAVLAIFSGRVLLGFTFKRVLMKGIQFIFWTLFDNLCYYVENTWQLDWWMKRPSHQLSIKAILVLRRWYDDEIEATDHLISHAGSRRENIFFDFLIFLREVKYLVSGTCPSHDDWSSVHRESKQQTKVLLSLHSVAPGSLI